MVVETRRYRRMVSSGSACPLAMAAVVGAALLAVAGPATPASAATGTGPLASVAFTNSGAHSFTVPAAVTAIHVVAIGGKGGSGYAPGGWGARVEADLPVTPGSTIYAVVGGDGAPATTSKEQMPAGGNNGGGTGGHWYNDEFAGVTGFPALSGGGGGGASDVQLCAPSSCSPVNLGSPAILLVAGGGGGAGADSVGGAGGTPDGGNALSTADFIGSYDYGTGATESRPGYNQIMGRTEDGAGGAGESYGAGGGGGGYYQGGGGAALGFEGQLAGGGGGGSSHGPAGTGYSTTSEPPSVTISYPNPVTVRLAPASRSSLTLDVLNGQVVQATPTGGASQLWTLVPQGALYQIVNKATGFCLSTDGIPGDSLFIWICQPDPRNLWQLPANFGAAHNGSPVWNPAYDLYFDVYGGSTVPGGPIDAWPYNGGYANQYFLPTMA